MNILTRVLLCVALCATPLTGHALYDPAPAAGLMAVEGAWQGTLEYRDYQPPHKRVTLPTKLFVAAASPNELSLHYIFDDGPKKIIHSYDRVAIDLAAGTVRFSGLKPTDTSVATVVSSKNVDGVLDIVAERTEESKGATEVIRYRLRLSQSAFEILKTAGPKGAEGEFRNQYSFRR